MYTIYDTAAQAIAVNAAAAEVEGCNMLSTIEKYPRIRHPETGQWALRDGTGPMSQEQMEAAGWFAASAAH